MKCRKPLQAQAHVLLYQVMTLNECKKRVQTQQPTWACIYIRQHLHPVRSFKFGDVQISNRLVLGKEDEKVVAHRDDGT